MHMQMTTPVHNHSLYLNEEDYSREMGKIESFNTRMSSVPIIEAYNVPCKNPDKDELIYTYVPEIYRDHLRSIISFIGDVHKAGLSFESFNESNIVFHDGVLKFKGLKFKKRASTHDKDKERDMELLSNVIEQMIHNYNVKKYAIPAPIIDLLEYIYDYKDIEDSYNAPIEVVLCKHLGILPHEESVELIKNFHTRAIKDGEDKHKYDRAVSEMKRREEYKEDWTWMFDGSNPFVGPAQNCFTHYGDKAAYKGVGTDRFVNGEIIRFCKNMGEHLKDHINECTGSQGTPKDTELTIMSLFDEELLSFQRLTYEYGIAHHFIPGFNMVTSNKCYPKIDDTSHRKAMVSRSLDHPRYINDGSRDTKNIRSFSDHYMSCGGDPIVDTYHVHSENPSDIYSFVPELHRSHIKAMVDFFCHLHQKKLSLESFEESNIVFDEGVLKFRGLRFVHHLEYKDRKRDLELLAHVIKKLFDKYSRCSRIPTPMNHLLSVMENYRQLEDAFGIKRIEYLLSNHLAVLSHEASLGVIKRFRAKYATLYGKHRYNYDKAVSEMKRRVKYKKDWTQRFTAAPIKGPIKLCFYFQFPKKNISEGVRIFRPSRVVNRHMLQFCRILADHLDQSMREEYNKPKCTKKDIELNIMAFFDEELLDFQWRAYKNEIAHKFIPGFEILDGKSSCCKFGDLRVICN